MSLYHCDRPEHGYGCFHLDELTPSEEEKLLEFDTNYGYLETLAEVDDEINDVRGEQESALEKASELEDDLNDLWKYRQLLEKKLKSRA